MACSDGNSLSLSYHIVCVCGVSTLLRELVSNIPAHRVINLPAAALAVPALSLVSVTSGLWRLTGRVEVYRFLLTGDLEGNVVSPNVGTEPARICKLGQREKITTSIKTWDNISPTHWKNNKNAKPDYVKAVSSMSKTSTVCVSILRLFNINWCYLTPRLLCGNVILSAQNMHINLKE